MFLFADRAFLIQWDSDDGLHKYLQPSIIDWHSSLEGLQLPDSKDYHEIGNWDAVVNGRDGEWFKKTNFHELFNRSVEVVRAPSYDFSYALLRNIHLRTQAYKLKMDLNRCLLCCSWHALFKFHDNFEARMGNRLTHSGVVLERLISIQLRSNSVQSNSVRHLVVCAEEALKTAVFDPGKSQFVMITNQQFLYYASNRSVTSKYAVFVHPFDSIEGYTHVHLGSKHLPTNNKELMREVEKVTFQHLFVMLKSAILVREKGHSASMGVVVDAIRRHFDPRKISYIAENGSCKAIPENYTQSIH